MKQNNHSIEKSAQCLQEAEGLLIGAGAGMGVDSGLPDFRGEKGFWKAYPQFEKKGLSFYDMANPYQFEMNPSLAWGFYGHRLNLYREIQPHQGFSILKNIGETKPLGSFVFTSNVDGQFQKAGFSDNNVLECHGSIHHLQGIHGTSNHIWKDDSFVPQIETETMTLRSKLPLCPKTGELARPNLLMFSDPYWLSQRSEQQQQRFLQWKKQVGQKKMVVIELGAGKIIPSVRHFCESMAKEWKCPLIRINLHDSEGFGNTISLPLGALDALSQIQSL